MFLKQVEPSFDAFDGAVTLISASGLHKEAEADERVRHFVDNFLREHKKPGKFYLHVNAMGAGEYYGSNRNGDYFPEENLLRYHKTFENGHLFRHHQNKDPEKAIGKVLMSIYNPRMHRVELVVEADKQLAADVESRIAEGDMPWTSMATKTPYDTCSVCGNQATSRMEYCDHLSSHMNELLPNGHKVYAINDGPLRFFDISLVVKPADPTSGILEKVAHSALPYTPLQDKEFRLHQSEMPLVQEAKERADKIMEGSDCPLAPPRLRREALEVLKDRSPEELSNLFSQTGIYPSILDVMKAFDPSITEQQARVGAGLLPVQNSILGMAPPLPAAGFLKLSSDMTTWFRSVASDCSLRDAMEKQAFVSFIPTYPVTTQTGYLPQPDPFLPYFMGSTPPPMMQAPAPIPPDQRTSVIKYLVGLAGLALVVNAMSHAMAAHQDKMEEANIAMMMHAREMRDHKKFILDQLKGHPGLTKRSDAYGLLLKAAPMPAPLKDGLETVHRANELEEDADDYAQEMGNPTQKQAAFAATGEGGLGDIDNNPVLAAEAHPYSLTPPTAAAAARGGSIGAGQGFFYAHQNSHINPETADLLGS